MQTDQPDVSAIRCGLLGRCPRCGSGPLFRSPLTLALRDKCPNCDLDYGFADSGDGPAVFVIMLLGFLVLGAALIVEFKLSPPAWVHGIWLPVSFALGFGMLRPMKSTLIALQYKHKAEEGRLSEDQP